jgi:hypothetical protein
MHRFGFPRRPPYPDLPGLGYIPGLRSASRALALQLLNRGRNKGRGKRPDEGGVPVEPNRPSFLSGGAAAALEFDE